jgi:type IV secretion system protein VirD4
MQVVNNALRCFREETIKIISSQNEIYFQKLLSETSPFAVFLIIPDESKERNVFARIFISQLYRSAVNFASFQNNLRLNKALYFILDEFSNFEKINNFSEMITISRSRNIFFQLVVQSFSQLVKNYGQETANIIFSNCALHTFLQTLDFETAKKYEMMIGEETILSRNITKNNKYEGEASSSTTTITGKKLITASELMRLRKNSALVFLDRNYPAIIRLKPFFE